MSPGSSSGRAIAAELTPLDSIAPRERSPGGGRDRAAKGGRGGRAPQVRIGEVRTTTALSAELIRRVVRLNYGRFRLCYEDGLKRRPTLEGEVTVHFVVEPDGRSSRARDGGSTLPDAAVTECLVQGFRALSFPKPRPGGGGPDDATAGVSIRLLLSPGSR